ncbi:MAG TPA: PCYCGC motif-containing (lipo)protein [Candidatus Angelobacter sp.]|jgi:hypothetical protein|nr:PCYCGC motif-containing (lipo)protein [Candidatus Angelobacter sp.]
MKFSASVLAVLFAALMIHGQFKEGQDNSIPAYHATRPAEGAALPPLMTQEQLAAAGLTAPAQKESYKAAARVSKVLYQQPCYCHCDRHAGHTSLRSCFETTHGANCGTCMAEALYTYQMSKKHWSPKMIRDGIMRQEYTRIDLQNPDPVQ